MTIITFNLLMRLNLNNYNFNNLLTQFRINMTKLFFGMILMTVLLEQDDFFTPGYSVGGYGELHYNRSHSGENATTVNLDFHRFIIYYGYAFSEEWSFKSEVELEHNLVHEGDGELELEQAFVNYHTDRFGFQAGVILPSVGIINESHEPPLFLSVERPEYSKYVIPTTWFGNGAAVYGKITGINWRFVLMEDLNGDNIGKGIRDGREKGYKSTAYDMVKNFSINYSGISKLRIGGSLTINDAPTSDYFTSDDEGNKIVNNADTASVGISLLVFHAKYDTKYIYAVAEYGTITYENNPLGYKTSGGYYMDLGYNVSSFIGLKSKLMPWIRISDYNRGNDDPSEHYTIKRFGVTYWPISNIVFKFDYGTHKKESDDDSKTQINIGVGYNF